jgi:hypothetical protein
VCVFFYCFDREFCFDRLIAVDGIRAESHAFTEFFIECLHPFVAVGFQVRACCSKK